MVGPHRSLVPRLVTSWSRNSISVACVDALPMGADPAGRCVQWMIECLCGAVFGVLIEDWWIGISLVNWFMCCTGGLAYWSGIGSVLVRFAPNWHHIGTGLTSVWGIVPLLAAIG